MIEPINPVEIRKSITNIKFPNFEQIYDKKQNNQDPYSVLGYFVDFQKNKKK
jgi:hypothetical protein